MLNSSNKSILYTATLLSTIEAFLIPHIEMLSENGCQIDIAAQIDKTISSRLSQLVRNVYNVSFSRNPLSVGNFKAYNQIKDITRSTNYDFIHTHTPIASMITRLAARKLDSQIIYTAHGFHFHKKSSLISWLSYYPIEKYMSKFTDVLITINGEDFETAKKSFRANKVLYIPGVGFDYNKFNRSAYLKKNKNIGLCTFVSVGELNKNKNHIKVIKAFKKINYNFMYSIAGVGPLEGKLRKTIDKYRMNDKIQLLGFVSNVENLLGHSDIFIFFFF